MTERPPNPGAFSVPGANDIKISDSKSPDITVNRSISAGSPHEPSTGTPLLGGKEKPFRFVATWHFWTILILGQILSWCIVSTNTLTEYLSLAGANIPAFQTVFNYALLSLVYTTWTLYKYGFKKWFRLQWVDGWKYFCLAFADVQGVKITFWGEVDGRIISWSRGLDIRICCRRNYWMRVRLSRL